jgi:hypothetical protein
MSIRILRIFLQNSKLNREKFVNNKKNYIVSKFKNRQQNYIKIITRKMTTYNKPPLSFGNGPNRPPNGSSIIYMILAAIGFNISVNIKKANSKQE